MCLVYVRNDNSKRWLVLLTALFIVLCLTRASEKWSLVSSGVSTSDPVDGRLFRETYQRPHAYAGVFFSACLSAVCTRCETNDGRVLSDVAVCAREPCGIGLAL